jgi:hypothetical protein
VLPARAEVAMRWRSVLSILAAAVLLSAPAGPPAAAAPAALSVGVVNFYSPTPLTPVGFSPEQYAADDLSALLSAGQPPFIVIPRPTMVQAQAAMHWQEVDVLHYDRLRALATAVGAGRLVVGWIPLLVIHRGGNGFFPGGDGEPSSADVNLVLQVFDTAQGRLVAERRFAASILGPPTRELVAKQVIDQALRSAAPVMTGLVAAGLTSRSAP